MQAGAPAPSQYMLLKHIFGADLSLHGGSSVLAWQLPVRSQNLPHQHDTLILLASIHNWQHQRLPYINSFSIPLEQNICYQDRGKKNQIKLFCSLFSVLVYRKQEIQDFYVR